METVREGTVEKGKAGVIKEETIKITYKSKKEKKELKLRRISYQDDKNRFLRVHHQ
jgi:hypothetical protein